jgi:hypothetical protein
MKNLLYKHRFHLRKFFSGITSKFSVFTMFESYELQSVFYLYQTVDASLQYFVTHHCQTESYQMY